LGFQTCLSAGPHPQLRPLPSSKVYLTLDLGPARPPWRFPVPDLIVEVLFESTETRDRGTKFIDYSAQGVTEYWIVDSERRVLEQYINEKGVLELKKKSNSGTVESKAISGFVIEIATLFDEQKNLDAIRLLFAG